MNKKGAEMTVGTLIIIILAILVLLVLVFGFTTGWGNLWGKISNFFGGGNNVQTIIQACDIACSTRAEYDYCIQERTMTGKSFVADKTRGITTEKSGTIAKGSCYAFRQSPQYVQLGFNECAEIQSCTLVPTPDTPEEKAYAASLADLAKKRDELKAAEGRLDAAKKAAVDPNAPTASEQTAIDNAQKEVDDAEKAVEDAEKDVEDKQKLLDASRD